MRGSIAHLGGHPPTGCSSRAPLAWTPSTAQNPASCACLCSQNWPRSLTQAGLSPPPRAPACRTCALPSWKLSGYITKTSRTYSRTQTIALSGYPKIDRFPQPNTSLCMGSFTRPFEKILINRRMLPDIYSLELIAMT